MSLFFFCLGQREDYQGGVIMKLRMIYPLLAIFMILCLQPAHLAAAEGADRWVIGSWQAEEMISVDSEILVVDFGLNGVWSYNGSWTQLSRWNPRTMVCWGGKYLAVDFGKHGLWNYDGRSWSKIAKGSI